MADERIRVGFVGCGGISRIYTDIYASLVDIAQVVAVADLVNELAHAELSDKIERLAVLPIPGNPDARTTSEVDGAWYALEDNPMGITRMRLSFKGDQGTWEYTNGQGDNVLRFGIGRALSGKFPQRNYFGEQIGSVPGIEYDCLASAAWIDE